MTATRVTPTVTLTDEDGSEHAVKRLPCPGCGLLVAALCHEPGRELGITAYCPRCGLVRDRMEKFYVD